MSATEPTRNLWHSGTDAIWASTPGGGAAESTPNDAAIILGHEFETALTSGRQNYIIATVAEWGQRVRDTLLPQHSDNGDHNQVTIEPDAAGEEGLIIRSDAGDADAQAKFTVRNSAGAGVVTIRSAGAMTIGQHGTDINKLTITSDASDALGTEQFRVGREAGATVFSVETDGTLNTAMPSYTLGLSPGMFSAAVIAAGSTDTAVVYEIDGATFNGAMNTAADALFRFVQCPEMRLQVGDTIGTVTLFCDRNAGSVGQVSLNLKNKSAFGTAELVGTVTINAGANNQSAAMSGTPHVITDAKSYYWEVGIANTTPAVSEVEFQYVSIVVTRAKVR